MKKIKATLSVFISLFLIFTMVMPAFAASSTCDCGGAPVIQVRGVGSTLYCNGEEVFSTENIITPILTNMPGILQALTDQNTADFVTAAEKIVKEIFAPVMYTSNGVRSNTITTYVDDADKAEKMNSVEKYVDFTSGNLSNEEILAYAAYEELGENHSYIFTYDWTGNPFTIADELYDYIEMVKEQSGHDKVSVCAESMGGAIINTYLSQHPFDHSIDTLVISNGATYGLEMMGQLFTGDIKIDGTALAELLTQEIRGSAEYESLLAYIPIFDELAEMVQLVAETEKEALYNQIFIPVFAYMPSFWCFVPEYSYDAAKDYVLGNAGYDLLKIINNYQLVTMSTKSTIGNLVDNNWANFFGYGIKYYNVTNYNRQIAPVTSSSNWNSDGVVEAYNASGYARVAKLGETLGNPAVQENTSTGYGHISPDNVIDASTCQFPMKTWFIKNLSHVAYGLEDGTAEFYMWLLTSDEQYEVDTNTDYPQFMYYDTSIPKLMTFAEKEENDNNDDGGFELPDVNINDLLGSLGSLGDIIGGIVGDGSMPDLDIGGLVGSIGGIVGGLGDTLSGLLGGLLGGDSGGDTPTTTQPSTTAPTTQAPATTAPTTQAPVANAGTNNNVVQNQPVVQTEPLLEGDSSAFNMWLVIFIIVLAVAGILVIKL